MSSTDHLEMNGNSKNGFTSQESISPVESMSKKAIIKNLLIICVAFLFMFCAFQALGNLQSTLNTDAGIGVTSQSVLYATLILSSFFLPTIVIDTLGIKKALAFCLALYIPYIAANMYPRWGTMIPAAIILGLGAAPMWSAKCTYLNEIGFRYARMSRNSQSTASENETLLNATIARFFGIFFAFFQSSQIWGNLISFLVLDQTASPINVTNGNLNESSYNISRVIVECGIDYDFVNEVSSEQLKPPSDVKRYTLMGVYLGMGLVAVALLLIFLDPLDRDNGSKGSSANKETLTPTQLVMATFKHLISNKAQMILIPLTMYSGLEQSFFTSEFTKAYVACSWSLSKIGLVAMAFGVVNAFVSPFSGHLIKLLGRKAVFILAALVNLGCCIVMLLWKPSPDDSRVYLFILAGLWGVGDAVWQTQINALYGVLFKGDDEPAYANYRMWESLGFVVAFGYAKYLNLIPKISILLSFLLVGISGYLFTEIKIVPSSSS